MFLLCALVVGSVSGWAATTYEQLTSIANIDESAQYVLGIDGTGFHYEGTSSWGKTALPSAQTPIYYTLTKASDGKSFTAKATISGTTYYLQVPTSNTFSMATSAGTNTNIIIGTTKVSGTNYAVANKSTTARHLRINGTSGLRSYDGTTGSMAFFYKVVNTADFTLTATSNNNAYGTVSTSDNVITATPATGYRVSTTTPYEVTSGSATVSQNGNEFTVTASSDCTVRINFEAIPTYAVTIVAPTGGTLTVMNGEAAVSTGDVIAVGTVLTITATPNANYNFRNWQAIDATTHTYTASNTGTYTMGENTVTFKANFDAKVYYAVTWMVNGSVNSTANYEEGDAIVFPTGLADVEGKSFVGWVDTEITGTTDEAPTYVTSATMGTSALTYYAVFADKTAGNQEIKIDELNSTAIGQTSYGNWSGKTFNSSAVYAGNSTTGTGNATGTIQIRSKENSGIVTTATGGKVSKVSVSWNITGSDKKLDVYGKNNAYSESSDLYDSSKQGTKIGSITAGTSSELIVDGDYTYLGLRSNDGALYLDYISVEWTTGTPDTYSGYCTTVVPDTRAAVNITSFTATATTLTRGGTATTTVANDQAGWTAAYTYSSDNTDVATVAADGVITAVAKGTANITATLNVDKYDTDYKAGETRSKSVAITVENPKHNVKFFNNGTEIVASAATVEEGEDIEFPTAPTAPASGFNFVGWATAAIDGTVTEAPATVTTAVMGTEDVNYYAVYGNAYGKNVSATFDASNISNLTSIGTRNWKDNETGIELYISAGQHYTSGTPKTWTVTQSSNSSDNCLTIGKAGCSIKKVEVTVSGANYVVGDYYAYENTDSETGTDLTSSVSTDELTSTLTLTDNYEMVALWSTTSNQIRATNIVVDAVVSSVGTFMTTVPTTVDVKITDAKYATFCCSTALDFSSSNVKAYTAKVNDAKVTLTEISNGIVPAYTGVILYCGTADTYAIPVTTTTSTLSNNELVGVTTRTLVAKTGGAGYNYIMQSDGNGGAVFNIATTEGAYMPAGKAYLSTDTPAPGGGDARLSVVFADEAQGISATLNNNEIMNNVVYDLQGRPIANGKLTKGLYIVNGKKTVVK